MTPNKKPMILENAALRLVAGCWWCMAPGATVGYGRFGEATLPRSRIFAIMPDLMAGAVRAMVSVGART